MLHPQYSNAALYCRVSTEDQNLDSQLQPCRAWCQQQGIPFTEYLDKASGAKTSRPQLDLMMQHIKTGLIQCVVCYKLDRLGRSMIHLAGMIEDFDRLGVAFVCPSQGIDTRADNPAGRLQMHILMAVAQFERSLIRERTKVGLAAARAKGNIGGRRHGQHPRTYAGKPVIPIDLPAVYSLIKSGRSWREAGRELGYKRPTLYVRLKADGYFKTETAA